MTGPQIAVFEPVVDEARDPLDFDIGVLMQDLRRSVARVAEFTRLAGSTAPVSVDLLDAAHSAERALLALDQMSAASSLYAK
jgi:hypothetical protein